MNKEKILQKLKNDEDYYGEFGNQFLSNSHVGRLLKDPLRAFEPSKPSPAFLVGGYFHTCILEPDKLEKFKVDEIPENLIDEEIKILSQGMTEDDAKKSRKNFEEVAKKRIKTGLILNEFGEQNKIKVNEQELQAEIQKQLRMMPGQEKMVMDFYQKNPSAVASLRGTVYEEKIINLIKEKAKSNKKEISKDEAEKILKESQNQSEGKVSNVKKETKSTVKSKSSAKKTTKTSLKTKTSSKKVSKK